MRNAEKVESFIRSVFEVYGLDYSQYFNTYTADDEKVELSMVMDGELDMTMVHRAAEILGENVKDLLSMNSKKAAKWQIRFPKSNPLSMPVAVAIMERTTIPFV